MSVRAPTDKRFRRMQVTPARRRRAWAGMAWWALRIGLLAAVAGYAGYRGVGVALGAGVLQVDRIVLHGNERLSSGEVLTLLHGLRGESILRADLEAYRKRLLGSPWVADAVLRRVLPSTVGVAIAERTPIGLGRLDGRLYLVDRRGLVIDDYGPQHAEFDLPLIDGLMGREEAGGVAADEARAALASRLLEAVAGHPELAGRLAQIDVREPDDAVVILEGDPALIHLGDDRFAERLQAYLELAPALRAQVPDIDHVDMRFEERIYVRPRGAAARGDARTRGAAAGARRF